jgi:hypothetical protein
MILGLNVFSLGLTMLSLMSYENPIKLKRENNKVIRNIDLNCMNTIYDENLRYFVLRMLNDDINIRPTATEIYDDLNIIEEFIKNPPIQEEQKNIDYYLNYNRQKNINNRNNYNQKQSNENDNLRFDYLNVNQYYLSHQIFCEDKDNFNKDYLGYLSADQINEDFSMNNEI